MKSIFELSKSHLRSAGKKYRLSYTLIGISIFMIIFFNAIYGGCQKIEEDELKYHYRMKEITVYENTEDETSASKEIKLSDLEWIKNNFNLSSITVLSMENGIDKFAIDGCSIEYISSIYAVNTAYDTFDNAFLTAEGFENANDVILAGRNFNMNEKNAVLIEAAYAEVLGYSFENVNELLGKEIVVSKNGKSVAAEIIGVYSEDIEQKVFFFSNSDTKYFADMAEIFEAVENMFIFSSDVISELDDSNGESFSYMIFAGNDMEATLELYNYLYGTYANEINCDVASIRKTLEYVDLISDILISAGTIVFAISFVNIISEMVLNMHMQSKYFALLALVGFTTKQRKIHYLCENLIILVRTILISVFSVYAVSAICGKIIAYWYEKDNLSENVFIPEVSVTLTVIGILLILFFGINMVMLKRINKDNALSLMRE